MQSVFAWPGLQIETNGSSVTIFVSRRISFVNQLCQQAPRQN